LAFGFHLPSSIFPMDRLIVLKWPGPDLEPLRLPHPIQKIRFQHLFPPRIWGGNKKNRPEAGRLEECAFFRPHPSLPRRHEENKIRQVSWLLGHPYPSLPAPDGVQWFVTGSYQVTVAGPRRICTGFPVMPRGAPDSSIILNYKISILQSRKSGSQIFYIPSKINPWPAFDKKAVKSGCRIIPRRAVYEYPGCPGLQGSDQTRLLYG
jgi:hypothetical protein